MERTRHGQHAHPDRRDATDPQSVSHPAAGAARSNGSSQTRRMAGPVKTIAVTINGVPMSATVEARRTLLDALREDFRLTGTHVGCEHGVCGCCNVLLDGEVVRGCLLLAAQVDGSEIQTVEGLEAPDGTLSPMQEAFCR